MNRLLTYAGQQPIYLGDVDFVQDAAKESFTCIARALMNLSSNSLNAILQGVELTQMTESYVSWTAGIVVLDGEILPIEAGSVRATLGSTPLYFHVDVVQSGERTFKDGVSRKCWATRSATIDTDASGSVATVYNTERLHIPSDDAEYEGNPGSTNITSARIVKKNGLWYIDVQISLESGSYTSIGTVTFPLANASAGAELSQKTFFLPLILQSTVRQGETTTIAVNMLPMRVTFSEYSGSSITMGLSFGATEATSAAGAGQLKTLMPIF